MTADLERNDGEEDATRDDDRHDSYVLDVGGDTLVIGLPLTVDEEQDSHEAPAQDDSQTPLESDEARDADADADCRDNVEPSDNAEHPSEFLDDAVSLAETQFLPEDERLEADAAPDRDARGDAGCVAEQSDRVEAADPSTTGDDSNPPVKAPDADAVRLHSPVDCAATSADDATDAVEVVRIRKDELEAAWRELRREQDALRSEREQLERERQVLADAKTPAHDREPQPAPDPDADGEQLEQIHAQILDLSGALQRLHEEIESERNRVAESRRTLGDAAHEIRKPEFARDDDDRPTGDFETGGDSETLADDGPSDDVESVIDDWILSGGGGSPAEDADPLDCPAIGFDADEAAEIEAALAELAEFTEEIARKRENGSNDASGDVAGRDAEPSESEPGSEPASDFAPEAEDAEPGATFEDAPFEEPAGANDSDDATDPNTIAAYMERLLGRKPRPALPSKPAPVQPKKPADKQPAVEAKDQTDAAPRKPRPAIDRDSIRANISTMREIANLSARTTLANHQLKQSRNGLVMLSVVAGSFAVVALALLTSGLWSPTPLVKFAWAAVAISGIAATELFRAVGEIKNCFRGMPIEENSPSFVGFAAFRLGRTSKSAVAVAAFFGGLSMFFTPEFVDYAWSALVLSGVMGYSIFRSPEPIAKESAEALHATDEQTPQTGLEPQLEPQLLSEPDLSGEPAAAPPAEPGEAPEFAEEVAEAEAMLESEREAALEAEPQPPAEDLSETVETPPDPNLPADDFNEPDFSAIRILLEEQDAVEPDDEDLYVFDESFPETMDESEESILAALEAIREAEEGERDDATEMNASIRD